MKSTHILGQRVDRVTLKQIVSNIDTSIVSNKHQLIFPMNIHILVELSKDQTLKRLHEKTASVIFADGMPLVWLSRWKKTPINERVSGTDLAETLLISNYRVFLLGSSPEVLAKMKKKYRSIVGTHSPPFKDTWSQRENQEIVSLIQESRASVLLVGLTPPKQERWLIKYFHETLSLVGIGVGSAFDILSGKTPRAPKKLKDNGLEWLWRILMEPTRLAPRYISDAMFLTLLSLLTIKNKISVLLYKKPSPKSLH